MCELNSIQYILKIGYEMILMKQLWWLVQLKSKIILF